MTPHPIYAPYHQRDITDWMVPDPDEVDDIEEIVRAMRALAEHEESDQ